jgi:hypothetical protein
LPREFECDRLIYWIDSSAYIWADSDCCETAEQMNCKLCGKEKKLVRAHIIPKSLWKPLFNEQPPLTHSAAPTFNEKKPSVGVYDAGIVCSHCESIFSPWDDYAQKLLLAKPSEKHYIMENGQRIAYIETAIDYAKLKLFFISLLWKAAVSNHYFFSRVNAGAFEPQLRRMILKSDPGDPDTFAVIMSKCEDRLGPIVLNPQPERWDEINYYRFYVAGYMVYIKVDRRHTPAFMGELVLNPERPFIIMLRELRTSKDFKVMQDIVRTSAVTKQSDRA